MPLTDPRRIARDAAAPRLLRLWRALTPLRSVISFMQTGAHPDDETSGMLAALGLRDGWDLSYACATRGEGGQNDVGREAGPVLGTLRTAEMERAAAALGLRLHWLSQAPGDIHDFGFSKSGEDTLARWGHARTLARMVHVVRAERPDAMCVTFLDVPGQHGHHRAMTRIALEAWEAAADPGFDGSDLPAWAPAKLYLPAWSGAGRAYDDDLPPPPETVRVDGAGIDPVTGASWDRLGQRSRACHATQGMGHWVPPGPHAGWPLHLARSRAGADGGSALDHLPGWDEAGLGAVRPHAEAALAAWPDAPAILAHACAALDAARAAPVPPTHAHRRDRKLSQLSILVREAAGVEASARLAADVLRPGASVGAVVELAPGAAEAAAEIVVPAGWARDGDRIVLPPDAPPTDPYPDRWLPDAPRPPALEVRVRAHGTEAVSHLPLEVPPVVLPARSARIEPAAAFVNAMRGAAHVTVDLRDASPERAEATLDPPPGWRAEGGTLRAEAPAAGLHEVRLALDGAPAMAVTPVVHDHVDPRAFHAPAILRLRVAEVAVPDGRVGYVSGGADRVGHWLRAIGVDARDLDDAALGDLADLSALVIGVFALRTRPALRAAMPRIRDWMRAGGTLVTLYHRPWDDWDAAGLPVAIGQPSLRWRVTDEAAEVSHLAPDHPVLTGPNAIGPQDWAGWDKERGLYFASTWDDAYVPLLAMSDPREAPLEGALLAADFGAGRHVHCALILHHQLERLVPGASRLMANLVAPRGG